MVEGIENIVQIAKEDFAKLFPGKTFEVEEVEENASSGHYLVTVGYWEKDSKPVPKEPQEFGGAISLHSMKSRSLSADLINPWRRKFKRVEVDPALGKAVAIRMYEPPLGVS